jgi:uncharacterized iron-regulated membrane protein
MKKTFTQSMAWLHTWGGLLFGWLLFAVFLTGSLSLFDKEISHWMRPELRSLPAASGDMADRAARYLRQTAPDADVWYINLPAERERALTASWAKGEDYTTHYLDPATGARVTPRETEGGHFLVHFHFMLNTWPQGAYIVASAALVMLTAIVSGIVIHRRRLFSDLFTFRPRAIAQRSWLDAHNAIGVLLLPFHLMIAYTGLVIFATIYMPAGIHLKYGGDEAAYFRDVASEFERPRLGKPGALLPMAPFIQRAETHLGAGATGYLWVTNPGDANAIVNVYKPWDKRVALIADHVTFDAVTGQLLDVRTKHHASYNAQWTLGGLHFAQFGGYPVRWLYFLAGLSSAAMIATGLVLFTVKRRQAHGATVPGPAARFYRFVEGMNVATVAGLMVAVAAYVWSNRLIPTGMPERIRWEIGAFLAAWALTFVHGFARRPARAWTEQFALAAALCAGLPLLNALTTGDHLFKAFARGDGMAAGVELSALGLGLLLAWMAWRVARRGTGIPLPSARRARVEDSMPLPAATEQHS